jgi:hypothetical protein
VDLPRGLNPAEYPLPCPRLAGFGHRVTYVPPQTM